MSRRAQAEVRDDIARRNRVLIARAEKWHSTFQPGQLAWVPPSGGWSIGTVFEHLVLAADSYLGHMEPLVGNATLRGGDGWRASFMGGMLVKSFTTGFKLKAPGVIKPGPAPREGVVEAFIERHLAMESLLDRAVEFDWNRLRMASPVARLVRLNIGDAFYVLVTHAERHFRQIDRIAAASGFPAVVAGQAHGA